MKALTLIRPWCFAILHCGKDIENRIWAPPPGVVGKFIAIHAGRKWDGDAQQMIDQILEDRNATLRTVEEDAWPGGLIVGVARIAAVLPPASIMNPEVVPEPYRAFVDSEWYTNDHGWVLEMPTPLAQAVPCTGMLKLWEVPEQAAERVVQQLPRALREQAPYPAAWA